MNRLTNAGLVVILGQVTLIMGLVLVASVVGIVVDAVLHTSPMFVLIGFGIGNVVAFIGIWLFIRAGMRRRDDTEPS